MSLNVSQIANSLAYTGVEANTPPNLTINNRPPSVGDYIGYTRGALWLFIQVYPRLQALYVLVDLGYQQATWEEIAFFGGVNVQFNTNDIPAVTVGNVLNLLGDTTSVDTTGTITPPNTVTVRLVNNPVVVGSMTLGANLILPATNGAGTAGVITVGGNPFMSSVGVFNTFLGQSSGNFALTGQTNTGIGYLSLSALTTGTSNTGLGAGALSTVNTGSNNTGIGGGALLGLTTGIQNTTLGYEALEGLITGNANIAVGYQTAINIISGANNILVGNTTGSAYTGAESNNILVGNAGVLAETNTMRLGTSGGGANQVNRTFIAGAYGVTPGGATQALIMNASGQIGTQAGGGGGTNTFLGDGAGVAITTGHDDTGIGFNALNALTTGNFNTALGSGALAKSVADTANIAIGYGALGTLNGGSFNVAIGNVAGHQMTTGDNNTLMGYEAGQQLTTGHDNTAVGYQALAFSVTDVNNTAIGSQALYLCNGGHDNTAIGLQALGSLTTGINNVAMGSGALLTTATSSNNTALGTSSLRAKTTGDDNTAVGQAALEALTTGVQNTALGSNAGILLLTGSNNIMIGNSSASTYTTVESGNIIIGSAGVIGDADTIRIGTSGTQTICNIAGIRGATTPNADAIAVLVDSQGYLGTVSSSRRFKENIVDMGKESSPVMKLRPVCFNFKDRKAKNYGLIAEEVKEVMPELVANDSDGQIHSVKYHDLPAILLNELQKALKRIEALEAKLSK